ncbi:hypothetical protein B5X24_HaOG211294 [Helicoverpa armigera]|uniref:Uncharacterized protein n=1 Tax=Helicoverpa armigera TaxID=29058 RepID=A0A2W1BKZ1_HELAM|nr:hypothetical protein B5X24_HaOG211294 [Helicoverpa armigera]
MSVMRLICLLSCRIVVPSSYESEGIVGAPVCAQMLVHYNVSCAANLSPQRLFEILLPLYIVGTNHIYLKTLAQNKLIDISCYYSDSEIISRASAVVTSSDDLEMVQVQVYCVGVVGTCKG